MTQAQEHRTSTWLGRVGKAGVVTAAVIAMSMQAASPAGAVPLPPPNPSDQEIQASENAAQASADQVGKLSAKVSGTQEKIRQLRDAMELKAELAMKARVDEQMAQADADDAEQAADDAQQAAADAGDAITAAQQDAAEFAAASFRQGSVAGSLTALLDADSMDQVLARRQMIEQVSGNQAGMLERLQTARTAKANLDSKAKAALADAKTAQQKAEKARQKADEAQQRAAQSFADGKDQLAALQAKLDSQQQEYQSALNKVASLKGQRAQYQAWAKEKAAEDRRIQQEAAAQRRHAQQALKDRQREQREKEKYQQSEKERLAAIRAEMKRQDKLAEQRKEQAKKDKASGNKGGSSGGGGSSSSSSSRSVGEKVVQAALAWIGTPYAWGGGTARGPSRGIRDGGVADYYGDYKKTGFDCSGLALYAWAQVGVYLPHYSGYQYRYGKHISRSNLQPGDLVFYAYNTSRPSTIHHVAIYMGHNQMVQAPQSGDVVKISPMRWSGYIGATRPGT